MTSVLPYDSHPYLHEGMMVEVIRGPLQGVRGILLRKEKRYRLVLGGDVAVDIRRSSPSFGQYVAVELSAENKRIYWIPEGFAHGFVVISDTAEFLYKTTDYWAPEFERSIAWNDPTIGIQLPIEDEPTLSAKDQRAKPLAEAEHFA